jgi:hypothetical protein
MPAASPTAVQPPSQHLTSPGPVQGLDDCPLGDQKMAAGLQNRGHTARILRPTQTARIPLPCAGDYFTLQCSGGGNSSSRSSNGHLSVGNAHASLVCFVATCQPIIVSFERVPGDRVLFLLWCTVLYYTYSHLASGPMFAAARFLACKSRTTVALYCVVYWRGVQSCCQENRSGEKILIHVLFLRTARFEPGHAVAMLKLWSS